MTPLARIDRMARFAEIVRASAAVAATRSRRAKVEHLAAALRALTPDEARVGATWLAGEVPQGKLGVGWAALRDVQPEPGLAPTLEVREVDAALERIQGIAGAGSKTRRLSELGALLARATADEQSFLRRLLVGELRQGALESLVVDAIASAAEIPPARVRRACMLSGDVGEVAAFALERGVEGLSAFRLQLFRPLQPMLAQTAADLGDALRRGACAFEWKLDGARVQVHRDGADVRVFSRRLNEVTHAVPEVVELVRGLPTEQIVLDGEVLALREDRRPHSFQTTMRRFGRRLDVETARRELPLSVYFFDCLHAGGDDLLDREGRERDEVMRSVAPTLCVPRTIATTAASASEFLEQSLAAGHEGVVAKTLDAPYEAGRRGAGWLKLKPSHTLDLVVLAAEWGSGRRRGWLSNLHLGARDEHGGFVMLGKTFKGMTDAMLGWQTERLQQLETDRDEHTVYVRPELVVEVAFDAVQHSPHYPGGVALRFARIKRYRDDKSALDVDSLSAVRALLPES